VFDRTRQWWQRDGWRLGVALALALGLHALLVLWVGPQRAREPSPAAARPRTLEVTLNPVSPPRHPIANSAQPGRSAVAQTPPIARPSIDTDHVPALSVVTADQPAPAAAAIVSELPRPVAAEALKRPATNLPASSSDSLLDRVIGIGSRGPQPAVAVLDRALDKPAPYAWLFSKSDAPVAGTANRGDVSVRLTPNTIGGYSYQGTRINAEIFEDGTVVLYDPKLVRAEVLGVPVERLPLLFKDPQAEIRRSIKRRRQLLEQWRSALGLPLGDDALNALAALHLLMTANSISGVYDLTEMAIRAVGDDPYASEKACFLAETETLRAKLRAQSLAQRDQRALDQLHAHLCAVWASTERPVSERRATLFQLWDECDDSESGQSARSIIVEFIRERLPESSREAFTAVELLALNARRSSAPLFSPYQ